MIEVIYIKQKQSSAKFRIIYPIDNLNDYSSNLSGDHFRFWNKKRNLSPDFIALEIITSLFKDFCRGNDPTKIRDWSKVCLLYIVRVSYSSNSVWKLNHWKF